MKEEELPEFVINYGKACYEYMEELTLHAEAQMRYAKALQNYQEAFRIYINLRNEVKP